MTSRWLPSEARAEVAEIARDVAGLPALLSQRTCERWASVPAADFLDAARDGAFPSSKVKRIVYAKTADVVAWIEGHRRTAPANDAGDEMAECLAAAGARRVGGGQ